jgi:phosphate starvation-inducible PhoH-like protein
MEFAPLAFMRGRSFNWSIAMLDEAQNATLEQLKLFLTRIGKRSKLIVTGDPFQSDLKNSGLMYIVDRLKDVEGVAIVNLPETAQVRNPLITKMLERI